MRQRTSKPERAPAVTVQRACSASEPSYQEQLDAWKAKHGVTHTDESNPTADMKPQSTPDVTDGVETPNGGSLRRWWNGVYLRLVHSLHLHPETESELDARLGDSRSGWLRRADRATIA